jgi:hypothetical protein
LLGTHTVRERRKRNGTGIQRCPILSDVLHYSSQYLSLDLPGYDVRCALQLRLAGLTRVSPTASALRSCYAVVPPEAPPSSGPRLRRCTEERRRAGTEGGQASRKHLSPRRWPLSPYLLSPLPLSQLVWPQSRPFFPAPVRRGGTPVQSCSRRPLRLVLRRVLTTIHTGCRYTTSCECPS